MKWLATEAQPNEAETDPTQKDQFDNADAGLDDTLVRESLQNSLQTTAVPRQYSNFEDKTE